MARLHSRGVRSKKYGDGGLGNDFSLSVREQMQFGHGGLRDNSPAHGGKIILPPVHGKKKKKTSGPLVPLVSRRSVTVAAKSASSRLSLSLSLHTCRPGLCVDRRHSEDFRKRGKVQKDVINIYIKLLMRYMYIK